MVCLHLLYTKSDVIVCDTDHQIEKKKNKSDGGWRKIKGEEEKAVERRAKEGVVVVRVVWVGAVMKSAAVSLISEWLFCSLIVVM